MINKFIRRINENKDFCIEVFILFISFTWSPLNAQTNESSPFKVTADLVSHYVWRGSIATGSPNPNFQPTLAYSKGNIEIAAWGSTDFAGSYKELDPYVTYTVGHIKLALLIMTGISTMQIT